MESEGSLHLLSWARSSQSMPTHPTSWRSIVILSSHLYLGLQSGLFPSGFPTKILYAPLLSPIHATCSTHLILLDLVTRTIFGEHYRQKAACYLVSFPALLQQPSWAQMSSLISNKQYSILFWDTPSLCSSPPVWQTKSHPYKTTGIITVLWIFDSKRSLSSIGSWFLHEWDFDLLGLFPNIWTVQPFQRVYYLSLCCDFILHADLETCPTCT